MGLFGFILVLACLPSALIDFALPQWKTEPDFQIEDAYKWIYQAARGGEHAVPDQAMAQKYLEGEWSALGEPSPDEQIWQPLCADESIGRINLRPFRAKGGTLDDLLDAFVKSSQKFDNGEANFIDAWNELGKRLKSKSAGNLRRKDWKRLDREMKRKNYPAIHHSKIYEESIHPAYRIVTADVACAGKLLGCPK